MPKSAQHFPTAETVSEDHSVDLRIVQCLGCGLVQLDNEPVPYYREVIRASAFSPEMGIFRDRQFADFVEQHALKEQKIIEIGCGCGEYLTLLRKQGVDAYGLEYAEASVRQCLQDGLPVQQGYVEHAAYKLDHGPFKAFFMFNFLEHMPEPITVLKGIADNLVEGAVGLVEVPNFDMMLRENLFTEFVTDHLCYFTRDTFQLLLGLSGFEVLECREIWSDYILSATVRKRKAEDVSGFLLGHQALAAELNAYIDSFGAGQVAIWGAGHQALAVMALAGMGEKIKYVVDSAQFKQNKLTPGTHLPIISPEIFFENPVDALIVMAAAYSDEVATIVKKHSKKPIQIAILRASGLEIL
jgi:SAM-dependent methyltransferase